MNKIKWEMKMKKRNPTIININKFIQADYSGLFYHQGTRGKVLN